MFPGQNIFSKELWSNGPSPGELYSYPATNVPNARSNLKKMAEYTAPGQYGTQQHTLSPTAEGGAVVGIKFDGGVMIAADNLVSYGSLARYQNVQRVFKINSSTIMGGGGDFADLQHILRFIDDKVIEDQCYGDNIEIKPNSLFTWLSRVTYNQGRKMDPLWLNMVVGGMEEGKPFLGEVDLRGLSYKSNFVVTGFAKHLAAALMHEATKGRTLSQKEATDLVRKCMEVLYYRNARAMAKYTVAVCTKEGSIVEGPYHVGENWKLASMVKGYM